MHQEMLDSCKCADRWLLMLALVGTTVAESNAFAQSPGGIRDSQHLSPAEVVERHANAIIAKDWAPALALPIQKSWLATKQPLCRSFSAILQASSHLEFSGHLGNWL
jgi:hypothetical protein